MLAFVVDFVSKYIFSDADKLMSAVTFTTRGPLNKSALRHANERLVLNVLRRSPAVSRADIVRITGLSPTSVTFIVSRLGRQKLIIEEKTNGHAQVGRQPTALRLCPGSKVAVGAEITLRGSTTDRGRSQRHGNCKEISALASELRAVLRQGARRSA